MEKGVGARRFLVGVLACALLNFALIASAQDDATQYDLDIAQTNVVDALNEFHLQTLLQVGYLPKSAEEEQTVVGPLKGRYTATQALQLLLEPVRFSFAWNGPNAIDVISPPDMSVADPSGISDRRPPSSWSWRRTTTEIERVLVTAGRIYGSEDLPPPVKTYGRRTIERSGAVTLADLLKYVSQQTYSHTKSAHINGAQFAQLRGLGPDMTLVLINGRRTLPSAANITANAFDLNTIPLPAVDRIEILLDSASAMYGADAIGGIVNVVLRRDLPRPAVDIHYGAVDGGGEQRRASLGLGHQGSRTNVALFADYIDVSTLLGSERSRWRNQDFRRYGGRDQRSINSAPGNITALLPGNLPGLPAPFAAVPSGSQGDDVATADFLATAGQRNFESLGKYIALVPESRRMSALASAEIKLAPRLLASGEVLHVDRRGQLQSIPPFVPGLPVSANSAFNPFGVPVIANVLLSGLDPQTQNVDSTLTRGVAALRGQWHAWEWEVSALHTDEEASVWIEGAVDFSRVMAALSQTDRNRALNVFQDGPGGSPELLASLLADRKVDRLLSSGTQAGTFARGSLPWGLQAGPLELTVGGEWREETAGFDTSLTSAKRNVTAGFAELKIPLVGAAMNWRGVDELTFTLSGRHDDYSDFGSILNPQLGLIWRINSELALRSSYSRSFRPPSLYELFVPKISSPIQLMDPRRSELAAFTLISGGNSELEPTRGESFTAGFALTPAALPGLEMSASYWQVAVRDRVSLLSLGTILANESAFPDRVMRADPTPADDAARRPGALRSIDISRDNLGRLETSGIDLNATYEIETSWGRVTPSVSATWIGNFETADLPFLRSVERVNMASAAGTIVRWRIIPRLEWQRGVAAASIGARYTPAYDDVDGLTNTRTGRRIRSQAIVDIQASLDFSEYGNHKSMWHGIKVTAGALNVFDEYAPFSELLGLTGFDMSQGDLEGRLLYLRLGKEF